MARADGSKKAIGVEPDYMPEYMDKHHNYSQLINLDSIKFEGLNYIKPAVVLKISNLKEKATTTEKALNTGIKELQGSGLFTKVNYKLSEASPYTLTITVEEDSRNSLNLGLRIDTKEMASILLNATFATKGKRFAGFDLTTRLNENPYLKVAYKIGPPTQRKSSLSYMIKYTDVNIYKDSRKFSNIDYLQNEIDLSFSNIKYKNLNLVIGTKLDFYDFDALYSNETNEYLAPTANGLSSIYVDVHYDSYDELYYPTKGISIGANYTLTSDVLDMREVTSPFGSFSLNIGGAISLSPRLTLLPSAYARILHGNNIAFPYRNFIGGSIAGRYFNSQMPFIGFHSLEEVQNTIFIGQFTARMRLWKNQYVSFKLNYANHTPTAFDFHKSTSLWGGGISYSYNSVVGPIELLVDMSNKYRKPGVYLSFGYYF